MSSDDNSVRIHDYSDHAPESIKNASRDIGESSSTTKQLVHTLVRTGAFEGAFHVIALIESRHFSSSCSILIAVVRPLVYSLLYYTNS